MPTEFCASDGVRTRFLNDQGFILLTVLWMLALLAVLSISFATVSRLDAKAKANLVHKAELQVLADGLVRYVSALSVQSASNLSPSIIRPVDGRWTDCKFDGKMAAFSVTDVVGLVDLNAATADLLTRLIAETGVPESQAKQIGAAVIDFRDGDDSLSTGGAESEDYSAKGRPFGPKNAPFETVAELDQVLGITSAIYEKLVPLVTVYSRRTDVDSGIAPLPVLRAVAGNSALNKGSLDQSYANRDGRQRSALGGRAYDISAVLNGEDGSVASRHAVIEIAPQDVRGFVFREWDTGTAIRLLETKPAGHLNDCVGR
jgi:general secretion pathway protein K